MEQPFHPLVQIMPTGCWEWGGFRDRDGYGRVGWNGQRGRLAHRIAYELANGPIAGGLSVCHSCDNPPCCNPEHLWLGDHWDNQADSSRKRRARGQDQTHYINGHEYSPQNTYWRPGKVAARDCRICIRTRVARHHERLNGVLAEMTAHKSDNVAWLERVGPLAKQLNEEARKEGDKR